MNGKVALSQRFENLGIGGAEEAETRRGGRGAKMEGARVDGNDKVHLAHQVLPGGKRKLVDQEAFRRKSGLNRLADLFFRFGSPNEDKRGVQLGLKE